MVIGITGTNGSGKGTVVTYLKKHKHFVHFAVREYLTELLKERDAIVDRSSMRLIANELRLAHDPAYVIRTLYERAQQKGHTHIIIESIRNVGEAQYLKSQGAYLIAIDADQKIRYERVQGRRSETDRVDFNTFVEHEEREMHPVGPYDMDVRGVMALADYTLINNGTLKALHEQIEDIFSRIQGSSQK